MMYGKSWQNLIEKNDIKRQDLEKRNSGGGGRLID